MKKILYSILCMPLLASAQNDPGLKFSDHLTWQQALAKAKQENKYLFVDGYATWCEPCKVMAREVFPQKKVGDYFGKEYLAISVQFDVTPQDSPRVQARYADAQALAKQFGIKSYPALLFFSPEGKLINRVNEFQGGTKLIAAAADAIKYDRLSKDYMSGIKDVSSQGPSSLIFLAKTAQAIKDEAVAEAASADYIARLKAMDLKEMLTKDNIEFLTLFTRSSAAPGFEIFYRHKNLIDRIMGDGFIGALSYAESTVDGIIYSEEIRPGLKAAEGTGEPDWEKMRAAIARKFSDIHADRILSNAKIHWYCGKERWSECGRHTVYMVRNYRSGISNFALNNYAWHNLFLHCDDKELLSAAIDWMTGVVAEEPKQFKTNLDTYANLLHKVGRTEEAIQWQKKAAELARNDMTFKKNEAGNPEIESALAKMQRGEPTWPQP